MRRDALSAARSATLVVGLLGVVTFADQAMETVTIFGSTGFTEPGGAMNVHLGAWLTLGWMLAFGLWGGVRGRAQNSAA
jgi:hypothetical protein